MGTTTAVANSGIGYAPAQTSHLLLQLPEGAPLTETGQLFASRTGCLSLHLPSLRSRSDEIPSLASLYLVKINQELNKQITGFAPHAMELLVHYSWPRNYAQFKQALFELATLTTSSYIRSSTVVEFLATGNARLTAC